MNTDQKTRRQFLTATTRGAAAGLAASAALSAGPLGAFAQEQADDKSERSAKFPYGKAEHCILIWLGGGASHLDTFDPKRLGRKSRR